jgi:RNA polymerase sigma-70 factor (ECF subfamily)
VKPVRPGLALGELAEAALVVLALSGDDRAYSEIVRRRQSALRNLMRRLCRDHALADDLTQQAFLQAWRTLRTLKSPAAFGGWLRALAVNVWLQHVRARPRLETDHDVSEIESLGAESELTSAAESAFTARIDLDAALAMLPANMRVCVVLAHGEGMSHSEISAATGLPLGTVKSNVARGAARLRELLRSYQPEREAQHVG